MDGTELDDDNEMEDEFKTDSKDKTNGKFFTELEYEGERLRLQARLEEEEEKHDPESLVNRLRDFEGDEKEDQRLEGANLQSMPLQVDDRTSLCNAT
ncbi:hypothetical protein ACROYT_G014184 [Oculina patagonica]